MEENLKIGDVVILKDESLHMYRIYDIKDNICSVHIVTNEDYKKEVPMENISYICNKDNVEVGDFVHLYNGVKVAWLVKNIKDDVYYIEDRWLNMSKDVATKKVCIEDIEFAVKSSFLRNKVEVI